jgi:hypothetical protein
MICVIFKANAPDVAKKWPCESRLMDVDGYPSWALSWSDALKIRPPGKLI